MVIAYCNFQSNMGFMNEDENIMTIASRLKLAREKAGYETAKEFADKHGIPQPTYATQEKGTRGLSTDRIIDYAKKLDVEPEWLLTGAHLEKHTTQVIGFVQAGLFTESRTLPEDEQESVPTPKNPWGYDNFTGLKVKGDSMDKEFPEGTTLLCVDVYDFKQPIETGLFVIVQRRGDGDTWESTVKKLVVEDSGETFLVPCSSNPRHQSIPIAAPNQWEESDHQQAAAPDTYISGVVVFEIRPRLNYKP